MKIILGIIIFVIAIVILYYIFTNISSITAKFGKSKYFAEADFSGDGKYIHDINGWILYECTKDGIQKYKYPDGTGVDLYVYVGQYFILDSKNPMETFRNLRTDYTLNGAIEELEELANA